MTTPQLKVRAGLRVLQVIYYDPVNYPPTLNAMRVLGEAGAEVLCLGYDRGTGAALPLPPKARIRYLNDGHPGWTSGRLQGLRQALEFRRVVHRTVRDFAPDLVIGYDHWGVCALLGLGGPGCPVRIAHLHDIVDERATSLWSTEGLVWAVARRALSRFPLVVVPEAARARFLSEAYGVSANFFTVGNSPKLARARHNDILRVRLGIPMDEPLAVTVGMMTLGDETVRAMSRTRARWHLVVIGCRNREWLAAMVSAAQELGLSDRLHIIPYTDYDTVREWLPGCDLGLCFYARSPNPNWNFMGTASVKIQEYMAAGIPSLVGMRDSLGQLAQDTGALHLIGSDDASAICEGLDLLEPGAPLASRLATAAAAAHETRYNCEAQLAPLLAELGLDGP